jgi:ABC-type nitrate/sulfonate/bicarbonate transport system ATPase subunit
MSASLNFFHVRKSYRRPGALVPEVVFEDFSLQLAPGELVALVGRSGIGKTTLLHLAAGLDTPDRGAVRIDGQGKPRIGMVFQQPRLLDWLSAADNIRVAIDAAGTDQRRGSEMLAAVGLADYAHAYPLALSGGQRQRVALARAFAIEPAIVLLDEPFSALDELTARRLRLLLQELWQAQAPTGLLVTHSTLEAAFLADRVLVLDGPPARILETIEIDLARPRSPEDPALFAFHRRIIAALKSTEPAEPLPLLEKKRDLHAVG